MLVIIYVVVNYRPLYSNALMCSVETLIVCTQCDDLLINFFNDSLNCLGDLQLALDQGRIKFQKLVASFQRVVFLQIVLKQTLQDFLVFGLLKFFIIRDSSMLCKRNGKMQQ
eukprot:TRINITY_DN1124_c1_g1_i15.p3 TRINITY_DN1124_c1_g1~~TRINITY_DN1124_c1_g1_i15.p3  ORF type:complete len:112 (-),score=4.71 TRINITY_DN1124_c1_g1_i15:123-458(-)